MLLISLTAFLFVNNLNVSYNNTATNIVAYLYLGTIGLFMISLDKTIKEYPEANILQIFRTVLNLLFKIGVIIAALMAFYFLIIILLWSWDIYGWH